MLVVLHVQHRFFQKCRFHALIGFLVKTNVSHYFTLFVKNVGFMRLSDNTMKSMFFRVVYLPFFQSFF